MFELRAVGHVESPLADRSAAPRQGDEGSPESVLVFDKAVADALSDVRAGADMLLFTWLHQGDRDVLRVHPRGESARPEEGVFSTRSPDRPNPIGLHAVTIVGVDDDAITVANLEAIDGTPVLDVKPVLGPTHER